MFFQYIKIENRAYSAPAVYEMIRSVRKDIENKEFSRQRVPVPLKEVGDGHFCACHFAEKSADEKRTLAKRNKKE